MKRFGLKNLIPVGITLMVVAAFAGSITGSLAWWAYSTRAAVSYEGTSVTTSEQLQIGLKLNTTYYNTDEKVNQLIALGLEEDEDLAGDGYRYVFAKAGGGLSAPVVKKYLETEGLYSTNELAPITSRTYTSGSNLTLYESLIQGHAQNDNEAIKSKYVYIPFVFRILKLNAVGSEDKYAGNRSIYLNKVVAEASSDNPTSKIQNAIRVHFNNGTPSSQFILNAGDASEFDREWTEEQKATAISNMYTNVGGVLDLNKDGVYDYDSSNNEIFYGDKTGGSLTPSAPTPTSLDNLNGVDLDLPEDATPEQIAAYLEDFDNSTTFLAAHGAGNNYYANYDGITIGKAYYRTLNSIKPDDSQAILSGGMPLCTTANSGNYLAELKTTIWLEGWDHEVIDSAINHKFNLGLQFQIDLVN